MVSYTLTGILYSKKNYDLEFKLNQICKKRNTFLTTSTDFIELTIKNAELKPKFIFCDLSTIHLIDYKIQAFLNRTDFNDTNIILIGKIDEKNKYNSLANNIYFVTID